VEQSGHSPAPPNIMVKSMFATACHRLPTIPYLLERESTSWLRKEIESREPEGPQDSFRTLTATACPGSGARRPCFSTTRRARVWSSASSAAAGPTSASANSGSGLAARLGLTERPRPRARIKRLDGFAGWAERDESRVLPLRSDDDPATVRDGR
jgi:hypothetical protein